jgi:hypothetical protein
MPVISGGNPIPGGNRFRIIRATYNFAVNGGAIGTINLLSSSDIPQGAIIMGGVVIVTTPPTSGGAGTLALQVEAAGDLVAAAAVSGAPWSTTGRKSVIPAFTGASSIQTTVARNVNAVIATAALTAGLVDVYLMLFIP